jgi:hypothetical protein
LQLFALIGLCDRNPNLSFAVRVAASLALADGDGPLAVTAATWKMKGAGVRGSKDL